MHMPIISCVCTLKQIPNSKQNCKKQNKQRSYNMLLYFKHNDLNELKPKRNNININKIKGANMDHGKDPYLHLTTLAVMLMTGPSTISTLQHLQ